MQAADAVQRAAQFLAAGNHEEANKLLAPLVEANAGGVEAMVGLCRAKHARHLSLASDIRFTDASQRARLEALELADRIMKSAPNTLHAGAAQSVKSAILGATQASAPKSPGLLVILIALAIMVFGIYWCAVR